MPLISYLSFTFLLPHWSLYQGTHWFLFHLGMSWFLGLRRLLFSVFCFPNGTFILKYILGEHMNTNLKGEQKESSDKVTVLIIKILKALFQTLPLTYWIWTRLSTYVGLSLFVCEVGWRRNSDFIILLEFWKVKCKGTNDFIRPSFRQWASW